MGSSSSKQLTIDELTMKTMMLAQRKEDARHEFEPHLSCGRFVPAKQLAG